MLLGPLPEENTYAIPSAADGLAAVRKWSASCQDRTKERRREGEKKKLSYFDWVRLATLRMQADRYGRFRASMACQCKSPQSRSSQCD